MLHYEMQWKTVLIQIVVYNKIFKINIDINERVYFLVKLGE